MPITINKAARPGPYAVRGAQGKGGFAKVQTRKTNWQEPQQAAASVELEKNDGEIEIDMLDLLYHLVDKLPQILIAGAICALLTAAWVFFVEKPAYQATSKLYVLSSDSLVSLQDLQLGTSLANDYMQVFSNVELHEQVRDKLKGLNYTDEQLDRMVSVSNPANTRIVVITVTSEKSQQEAMELAEAYATKGARFIAERIMNDDPNDEQDDGRLKHEPTLFEKATERRVSRQQVLRIVLFFLLGALAMAAFHVIYFIADDRITTSEFIEKRTGITTLGMMPILNEGAAGDLAPADKK